MDLLGAFLFNMHDISIIIQNISSTRRAATQLTSFHIRAFISGNVTHPLHSCFPPELLVTCSHQCEKCVDNRLP